MAGVPLMLIHGALSDLLSVQGVKDMVTRRPDIDLVTVADQGHAPLLADKPTMDRIVAFCERCDKAKLSAPPHHLHKAENLEFRRRPGPRRDDRMWVKSPRYLDASSDLAKKKNPRQFPAGGSLVQVTIAVRRLLLPGAANAEVARPDALICVVVGHPA
jgi:hypothetical protein